MPFGLKLSGGEGGSLCQSRDWLKAKVCLVWRMAGSGMRPGAMDGVQAPEGLTVSAPEGNAYEFPSSGVVEMQEKSFDRSSARGPRWRKRG